MDWRPANEAEASMAGALASGDDVAYLRAAAGVPLVLPVTAAAASGAEAVRWATVTVDGTRYALPYTTGAAAPAAPAVRESTLFDVVYHLLGLTMGLAIDPGLPVQRYFAPSAVQEIPAWEAEWAPLEAALRAAVGAEDSEAYLRALLGGSIVLPRPDGAGPSRDVRDPAYPWWRESRLDGAPVILGFTSPLRMHTELGERDAIEMPFADLARAWPDRTTGLRLNPGAPNGTELAAELLASVAEALAE
jgi:hypothetical protein